MIHPFDTFEPLYRRLNLDDLHSGVKDNVVSIDYGNKTVTFKNGIVHNDDGPAITYPDGRVEYFDQGIRITEQEFNQRQIERDEKETVQVIFEGNRYTVPKKIVKQIVSILTPYKNKVQSNYR